MNKCQKCKKARATVHLTEIDPDNHKPHEMHLCENCARETGMPEHAKPQSQSITFNTSLIDMGKSRPKTTQRLVCSGCGMSYQEFRVKGRFGCCECYDAFAEGLESLLDRVHGANRYVGPRPEEATEQAAGTGRIERELVDLRKQLLSVVEAEDYEEAARIRDRIHEAEERLMESGDG